MSHALRRLAFASLSLALAACAKKAPNATREECRQYRAKLFELLPDAEREHWRASGLDKASKLELDFCQQRVTSAEVACVRNKTTLDDALACKPTVDLRPADMRRTPEECSAYREHVVQLAADGEKTETLRGDDIVPRFLSILDDYVERRYPAPGGASLVSS